MLKYHSINMKGGGLLAFYFSRCHSNALCHLHFSSSNVLIEELRFNQLFHGKIYFILIFYSMLVNRVLRESSRVRGEWVCVK